MKKPAVLTTYLTVVMAIAMTFTVACTRTVHSSGSAKNVGLSGPGPVGPTQSQPDGTTDGAGGNGVNGKIYESYIVNPQELPAYKNIIQPKIENLDKTWNADEKPDRAIPLFSLIWKFKKWYLAPISLKSLNKKTIGVEFTKGTTEQLAIQTETEIWIDSVQFEKMSLVEQAQLLMHEYAMNIYLFKFESFYDLCMLGASNSENPKNFDCGTHDSTDQYAFLAPEPKRDLNKNDYSNIRYVTASLMQKTSFGSKTEINNLFLVNKFDRRVFSNDDSQKPTEQVQVTANEIVAALKQAAYSQAFNGPCVGVLSGIQKECIFEVKDEPSQPVVGEKILRISLKDASTQEVLRSFALSITDMTTYGTIDTHMIEVTFMEKMPDSEGAIFDGLHLKMNKYEHGSAVLKRIFFQRNIVTSIITKPAEKSSGFQCKEIVIKNASSIKTKLFEQDAVSLGMTGKEDPNEFVYKASGTWRTSHCSDKN